MINLVSLRQVVIKTIAEAFAKQFDRKQLDEGVKHSIEAVVTVNGSIDGKQFAFDLPVESTMTVGHSTTRASSVTPATENQLAYVLELIELAYGEDAVSGIVEDLVAKYEATRDIPASEKYAEIVANMSRRMREERSQDVAGSVSVKHASKEAVAVKFDSEAA